MENESIENKETDEVKEKKETKNKSQNVSNLFWSIIEDFVWEKLDKNIDFFNKEELEVGKNYENVKEFLYNGVNYEDYTSDFDNLTNSQKKYLLDKAKLEIAKQKIGIDKNLATAKKIINEEYEIKDKTKLDEWLKKVYSEKNWKQKIKDILKKSISRAAFLKNNLKGNFEKKEKNVNNNDIENIISNIKWLDINKLNEQELYSLKKIYNSRNNLELKDLKVLIDSFDIKSRNALLKDLNPTLNLKELVEIWILTEKQATDKLEKQIKQNSKNISKKELNKIINNEKFFNDIYITIDELQNKEQIKFFDNNNALQTLLDELNYVRNEVEKKENLFINDELLDLEDIEIKKWEYKTLLHKNFIDFIKNDYWNNLLKQAKDTIDNFQEWWYIKINSPEWVKYYYVDKTDIGWTKYWKHFLVKKLNSAYWIKKPENSETEKITYEELYNIIKNFNNNKELKSEIEFLNKKDFEQDEKTENIEKAPDEKNIQTEQDLRKILSKEGFLEKDAENVDFKNLTFKDKDSKSKKDFYRNFTNYDDSNHELIFEWSWQRMKYSDFLDEFRKSKKYKLEKKISNVKDLIDKSEFFKKNDLVLHNSKNILVKKWQENDSKAKEVKTIIWDQYIVNIKNISENNIEYSVWKIKWTKEKKKTIKVKEKNDQWKIIEKEKEITETITYDIEDEYLFDSFNDLLLEVDDGKKWYKLLKENQEVNTENDAEKLDQKSTFFGKVFTLSSFAEILAWWEMMTTAIKEYFERWNDLRAAKWAKMFWSFLPKDVKAKLEFNATEKKKEIIDKIYKELTEADWTPAIIRIKDRILWNANALPEEVFAAMKYMVTKRWSLYAKKLIWKEKDFIWYQKLWWKKWDAFYNKYKANIDAQNDINKNAAWKADPIPFTEEWLIEEYLWRYQKNTWALYPRVEKDFWGYIKDWQNNRYKKWEEETWNLYSISERINYFTTQLIAWEKSRALWAANSIIQKNSTFESIYLPWFMITMSWISNTFNGIESNKLMWYAFTTPSTAFLFSLDKNWIETYQNALINYYKQTNNIDKAEKLKTILSMKMNKRIEALSKFWLENKNEIMDFYNLKNPYILLNKWTEKDEWWYYQKIFDTYKWSMNDAEYSITENSFLPSWQYSNTAFTEVQAKLGTSKFITSWTHAWYSWNTSGSITKMYYNKLLDIKKTDKLNLEEKRKLFKEIYNPFHDRISKALWQHVDSEKIKNWEIYKDMHKINLLFRETDGYDKISNNEFLDIAFDHFMNNEEKEDDLDYIVDETNKKVDYSLKQYTKPSNNEN